MMTADKQRILFMAQFAMLLAIEAIFCFTPLGSIPIGVIVATLAMLPVVITAILLGTKAGAAMGFMAGLFSFLVWTFMPPGPTGFVFTPFQSLGEISGNGWSLVICFVPRILVGVVTGLCYRAFSRSKHQWLNKPVVAYGVSAILGSLTNTFLVLGGIWLFFGQAYADAMNSTMIALVGMSILTNGIPEAIVCFLAATAICTPLKKRLAKGI